jgi:hypothetical protein
MGLDGRNLEVDGLSSVELDHVDLPPLESLVMMMRSDPIQAIRLLPAYPFSELSTVSARDLNDLLKAIYKNSLRHSERSFVDHGPSQFEQPLTVLRALLHDLPTSPQSKDKHLGKRFRGDLLGRFLRACIILDCESILKSTLREKLEAQKIEGTVLVQPDQWASQLAREQKWDLIISLLSPWAFPIESFTPYTILRLIEAHIGLGDTAKVPSLFRLYAELGLDPPPRVYSLLVQSHLKLGDLDTARNLMKQSLKSTKADDVTTQLAILKGYRELGRDIALEERVVEALDGMEERSQVALLHALIRLQLDSGDDLGARNLLRRFDSGLWNRLLYKSDTRESQKIEAKLPASPQTHYLAFRLIASTMSFDQLSQVWEKMKSESMPINDQFVRILVKALARLSRIDVAQSLFNPSAVDSTPLMSLPETYKPKALAMNTLLKESSRIGGWKGLETTLKLFRSRGVNPNEETLEIVLGSIRDNITANPTVLANLTNAIIGRSPNIKPTVDHLDLLLAQAVRAHARAEQVSSRPANVGNIFSLSDENSTAAEAGLKVNDPFKLAIRSMLNSLRSRGVRSSARSLATRLRFDAQRHASSPLGTSMTTAPSPRAVWDDLITRGYKPNKRHFLALMKGYADFGHMVECEDIVILAKEMGIEPTRGMWMVLMNAYGTRRKPWFNLSRSEKAFHAIRQSQQGLDLTAICSMIGIYYRGGQRQSAVDLALRLIENIVNPPSTSSPAATATGNADLNVKSTQRQNSEYKSTSSSTSATASTWKIPEFSPELFQDQSISIITNALRLDHPNLALQVIQNRYLITPTSSTDDSVSISTVPTRVRDVVKSINNRARARIGRGIANDTDYITLRHSEEILDSSSSGRTRPIGPKGLKKKMVRLFAGVGGRRKRPSRAERRVRDQEVVTAVDGVEQSGD